MTVKDPEKAPLVKKAFELYATGNFNVFDICDIMYEKGLQTKHGKKIGHSRMYEVLKNRFYIGEVNWGSVRLKEGKHDHLIDDDLFDKVQKILASKISHACRRRKYAWLLNGFLRCHNHQCRYTAENHFDKKKSYYHCTNAHGCGKYIETSKMESMISNKFKDIEFSQEFIDQIIDKAKNIFYERRKAYDDKRKELVNQQTALKGKRDFAEQKLLDDVISDDDFRRIRLEIGGKLETIDGRMIELEREREMNIDTAQEVLNLSRNIYDAYNKASFKLKRQYLGFFWERFEVANGVIIKSAPSLLFEKLLELEKAFYKNDDKKKPIISNDYIGIPSVINSSALCSR